MKPNIIRVNRNWVYEYVYITAQNAKNPFIVFGNRAMFEEFSRFCKIDIIKGAIVDTIDITNARGNKTTIQFRDVDCRDERLSGMCSDNIIFVVSRYDSVPAASKTMINGCMYGKDSMWVECGE